MIDKRDQFSENLMGTTGGTKVTRETISNIESKLPSKNFLRIHRSFIIALDKIESYSSEEIIISQSSIPISRSYRESIIQKLEKFQ